MPETLDYDTAPNDRWVKFRATYLLDEGILLTVLFPDGTVADGTVKKRMLMRSGEVEEVEEVEVEEVIEAWGVVVDGCWYDLIDVKVDADVFLSSRPDV